MTREIEAEFIRRCGTGTGPTRYRQLRDFCQIGEIPLERLPGKKERFAINTETIVVLKQLSVDQWKSIFNKYRQETKGQAVRLSEDGLEEIISVISESNNPLMQNRLDLD